MTSTRWFWPGLRPDVGRQLRLGHRPHRHDAVGHRPAVGRRDLHGRPLLRVLEREEGAGPRGCAVDVTGDHDRARRIARSRAVEPPARLVDVGRTRRGRPAGRRSPSP